MLKIPFTVYAKIVPDRLHNARRTYTKSLEKISKYVAEDINNYAIANPNVLTINENIRVSSTVQFAQYPSRVTITGWHFLNETNFQPASKVSVDAPFTSAEDDNYDGIPGKVVEGYAGTQYLGPQDQTLDPRTVAGMRALKAALEAASPYLNDIFKIEYQGIAFGQSGTGF